MFCQNPATKSKCTLPVIFATCRFMSLRTGNSPMSTAVLSVTTDAGIVPPVVKAAKGHRFGRGGAEPVFLGEIGAVFW